MTAKTKDTVESQLCHEREEKFTPPLSYRIIFDSTYEHSVQISATPGQPQLRVSAGETR